MVNTQKPINNNSVDVSKEIQHILNVRNASPEIMVISEFIRQRMTHTKLNNNVRYCLAFENANTLTFNKRGEYDIKFDAYKFIDNDEIEKNVIMITINNQAFKSVDTFINALINAHVEFDLHVNLLGKALVYDKNEKLIKNRIKKHSESSPYPTRQLSKDGGFHRELWKHYVKAYGLEIHQKTSEDSKTEYRSQFGNIFKPTRLTKTSYLDYMRDDKGFIQASSKVITSGLSYSYYADGKDKNSVVFDKDTVKFLESVKFVAGRVHSEVYNNSKFRAVIEDALKYKIIEDDETESIEQKRQNKITLQINAGSVQFDDIKLSEKLAKELAETFRTFKNDKVFSETKNEIELKDLKISLSLVSEDAIKDTSLKDEA